MERDSQNSWEQLRQQLNLLKTMLSKSKAIKAVAHKLARLIYRLLKHGHAYVEVGQEQYEQQHKKNRIKNMKKNAQELGYDLVLKDIGK